MDIRVMEYYLAVAREGNISAAAETLHVSQPSLSRQMKDLETELGVTLFERGNRRITLTEEGMILRRRAEEIVRLVHQTEKEVAEAGNRISGDIYIGAGESHVFHYISRTAGRITEKYPEVRFHIASGDTRDLMEQLAGGLIDFALIFTEFDHSLYHSVSIPEKDIYGILMRKDSPLAEKKEIRMEDLKGLPVMVSRAAHPYLDEKEELSFLNIIGTYNLLYNASLMVEDGVGYAFTFDRLVHTGEDSPLCFRPLTPQTAATGILIWKKYQIFTPAVQLFIDELKKSLEEKEENA